MKLLGTGTAIALYAESIPYAVSVAVVIDGNPGYEMMWGGPGDSQYQQKAWQVTELPEGDHQIMINYYGNGDRAEDVLGLDYFEYVDCTCQWRPFD